jgi:phage/plasmid-associated DNA primase
VTKLHRDENVGNTPLRSLVSNHFAAADLEGKSVNIDMELSSSTISDMAMLKKLTGQQRVRIEKKNKPAYRAVLYAKLFFSANEMPDIADSSDGHSRRETVVSFPNQFEGKNDDKELKHKLSTEMEPISGIFNMLTAALRRILKNKQVHVDAKNIAERRRRHGLTSDAIKAFTEQVVAEDSADNDRVRKEDVYEA